LLLNVVVDFANRGEVVVVCGAVAVAVTIACGTASVFVVRIVIAITAIITVVVVHAIPGVQRFVPVVVDEKS